MTIYISVPPSDDDSTEYLPILRLDIIAAFEAMQNEIQTLQMELKQLKQKMEVKNGEIKTAEINSPTQARQDSVETI
jgi:cell division septum initiation protein DivIVA